MVKMITNTCHYIAFRCYETHLALKAFDIFWSNNTSEIIDIWTGVCSLCRCATFSFWFARLVFVYGIVIVVFVKICHHSRRRLRTNPMNLFDLNSLRSKCNVMYWNCGCEWRHLRIWKCNGCILNCSPFILISTQLEKCVSVTDNGDLHTITRKTLVITISVYWNT